MVALVRMVAAGEANIGHLRKDGTKIYREMDTTENLVDEPLEHLPQQERDEKRNWVGKSKKP